MTQPVWREARGGVGLVRGVREEKRHVVKKKKDCLAVTRLTGDVEMGVTCEEEGMESVVGVA